MYVVLNVIFMNIKIWNNILLKIKFFNKKKKKKKKKKNSFKKKKKKKSKIKI